MKQETERATYKRNYLKNKKEIITAISAYSTHGPVTFDEWHEIQKEAKTLGTPLNLEYRRLMK